MILGSQAKNSRPGPGSQLTQRPWRALRTGLLLLACSICFLKHTRTTCPGVALPTKGWALPYRSLIRKIPTGLPIGQSIGGLFSIKSPYPHPLWICCVKMTKQTRTSGIPEILVTWEKWGKRITNLRTVSAAWWDSFGLIFFVLKVALEE